MPKFRMPMWKSKFILQDSIHGENIMILILRSKVKVIQSLWMIHSLAKQCMTMSKDKNTEAWTRSHVINTINLTLKSKFNVVSGSWMYLTHCLMVIDTCAKYGMPMVKGHHRIWNECTRLIVLWWYTDVQNMVSQCQSKKSDGLDTNLHRQKDRRTGGGVYNNISEIQTYIEYKRESSNLLCFSNPIC